ncbi:alpha-L-arabinofuranosidase C-terminal domain-containing protein [Sphingobacterium prati]|uniref:alpha-L-arabinofuranosidase C-terminal domain-containing protein n=1 Tax=Sphingobacterium prati TaxID=2737006 RepID=UPI001556A4F2|nr:alpha-L-arabinofuranosidase C-terminal domain-containing protein [Sphingobacterium prati]NPE47666.1 alpha-L-arabinofuranosidase [Sphingobacterium prati]
MKKVVSMTLLLATLGSWAVAQSPIELNIQLDQASGKISPHMWGVFFEDINLGADGGIYAELVKNRSFEFDQPWMGWKKLDNAGEGTYLLLNDSQRKGNKRYLRLNNVSNLKLGLQNEGFRGMGVKDGEEYEFSLQYRSPNADMKINVEVLNEQDKVIGSTVLPLALSANWSEGAIKFPVTSTTAKAKLNVWFSGAGVLDVDMLSLFPKDTWKGRSKGLRKDMVQMLADMKPGFIRFPGGCIVEGRDLANRFQWKKTVGPINERELIINRWNTEFKHRLTPDYFQTFGLGFYEYFLLAEDIGAAPVPILNCGMACQFNTGELVPLEQLDEYVQDALDLIEFANGSADTKWGKLRAEMGHPESFNLKMIGVGNENWGPQYIERLAVFKKALNEKHPEIAIIASSGTDPEGDRFDFLNDKLRAMNINIIDEHYYRPPSWFLSSASRYDHYDRKGAKIFAGEYASHTTRPNGPGKSTWEAALSEAAFMTGLERNGDVVEMASYAPLFGHVDGWQWSPDLIWVDNLQVYGTPSYQVQKLYSTNRGSEIIPITRAGQPVAGKDSLYASAVYDQKLGQLIVKLINYNSKPVEVSFDIASRKKLANAGEKIILAGKDLNVSNSIEEPLNIQPKLEPITFKGKKLTDSLAPYSFTLIKLQVR